MTHVPWLLQNAAKCKPVPCRDPRQACRLHTLYSHTKVSDAADSVNQLAQVGFVVTMNTTEICLCMDRRHASQTVSG